MKNKHYVHNNECSYASAHTTYYINHCMCNNIIRRLYTSCDSTICKKCDTRVLDIFIPYLHHMIIYR